MRRRKHTSPMPWRQVVTPRAMKVLALLAASMTLGTVLLLWVEPAMENYRPSNQPLEPPQIRLSAQSKWDCIYIAATPSANDFRVPCHFWVPIEGKWQHGAQPVDEPIRCASGRVLRIGIQPSPRGGGLTDAQWTEIENLLEFARMLGIPHEALKPDPNFHPGHRVMTRLTARPS